MLRVPDLTSAVSLRAPTCRGMAISLARSRIMSNQAPDPKHKPDWIWHLACPPDKFFGRRGTWISIVIRILALGLLQLTMHAATEEVEPCGDPVDAAYASAAWSLHAQVCLPDGLVLEQFLGCSLGDDMPPRHDIVPLGEGEGKADILFSQ